MYISAFILFSGMVLLYFYGKDHTTDEGKSIAGGRRQLLPIGLALLELCHYRFRTSYDRAMLAKWAELMGQERAMVNHRQEVAFNLAFGLLLMTAFLFIGGASDADPWFLLFVVGLPLLVIYFSHRELDRKLQQRRDAIQRDFPDFLSKLVLLVNAGLTSGKAMERILGEKRRSGPLYCELWMMQGDLAGGKGEIAAYESLARRCRSPLVTRFVSVMLQNSRRGGGELTAILRLQATECWEIRKRNALRLGEEASTKLILPMMIMFAAILLIVAAPAVMGLRGFKG